jgi:hypothetical protein
MLSSVSHKECLWNFYVLQRVHLYNLVSVCHFFYNTLFVEAQWDRKKAIVCVCVCVCVCVYIYCNNNQ